MVSVDDVGHAFLDAYSHLSQSLFTEIDNHIVGHLRFRQSYNVGKGHAHGIDGEEEHVACSAQAAAGRKVERGNAPYGLYADASPDGWSIACEDSGKGIGLTPAGLCLHLIIYSPQRPHVA